MDAMDANRDEDGSEDERVPDVYLFQVVATDVAAERNGARYLTYLASPTGFEPVLPP